MSKQSSAVRRFVLIVVGHPGHAGFSSLMHLAILLVVVIVQAGCAPEPLEASLAQLDRQQSEFDGRDVVTSGVLRTHDTPRHYWIADAADHRVELISDDDLAPMVGLPLGVRGRFRYGPDIGRRIEVAQVWVRMHSDAW